MTKKTLLFDLDGTLTDSGEGIINCALLALNHYGITVEDRNTMRVFVGPPLVDSFVKFGVPAEQLFGEIIDKHINNGLLTKQDHTIMLTEKGIDLANQVLQDFI